MKSKSSKKNQSHKFLASKNQQLQHLLDQIQCPQQQMHTPVPATNHMPSDHPDSLTLLLSKAKNATQSTKNLKVKPRQSKRLTEQQAFLTGVQIEVQNIKKQQQDEKQQALDQEVKKLLGKKSIQDELALLRQQIKKTNGILRSYSKQTLKTQKSVVGLAGRYHCHFNLKIPVTQPTVDFAGYSVGMRSIKQLKLPSIN